MGIPLLARRDISLDDRRHGRPVVVVSEAVAQCYFDGEDPVGQQIRWGRNEDGPSAEIVGLVEDVHHSSLRSESLPQAYVPFTQWVTTDVNFVLEGSVSASTLARGVRDAIEAVDPDQPLLGVRPASQLVAASISTPRFRTLLMVGFGLTAMLLAAVGLYGVIAYNVAGRTKELGVRMALGATRRSVFSLVLRESLPVLGAGIIRGLGGAFALSRIMESMLFGVGARDPGVFTAAPLLLGVVAVVATVVPAHRASRADPMRTLEGE